MVSVPFVLETVAPIGDANLPGLSTIQKRVAALSAPLSISLNYLLGE